MEVTWRALTLWVRLASSSRTCQSASTDSQAGEKRPGPYCRITGCTGAPARNAPDLNGSKPSPFVVVPCHVPRKPYSLVMDCLNTKADNPVHVVGGTALRDLQAIMEDAEHVCASQAHAPALGVTSGKSSSGRVVGGSSPAAAISMRSFTCPATPCKPESALQRRKDLKYPQLGQLAKHSHKKANAVPLQGPS